MESSQIERSVKNAINKLSNQFPNSKIESYENNIIVRNPSTSIINITEEIISSIGKNVPYRERIVCVLRNIGNSTNRIDTQNNFHSEKFLRERDYVQEPNLVQEPKTKNMGDIFLESEELSPQIETTHIENPNDYYCPVSYSYLFEDNILIVYI